MRFPVPLQITSSSLCHSTSTHGQVISKIHSKTELMNHDDDDGEGSGSRISFIHPSFVDHTGNCSMCADAEEGKELLGTD